MNKKVRCTDLDISNMLDSSSDSDHEVIHNVKKTNEKVVTMTETNRSKKLEFFNTAKSKVKSAQNDSTLHQLKNGGPKSARKNLDSSKEESKCNNLQDLLIKKLAQRREEASMKIKLRRSTEQSNYKIDSDSDFEYRKRKPSRSVSRNVLKDNSLSSTVPTIKIKVGNEGNIISYEEHDADNVVTISSGNEGVQEYSSAQAPNLEVRNNVNYNENKLLNKRQVSDEARPTKKIKRIDHHRRHHDRNSDDLISSSENEYVPNDSSLDRKDDTTSLNDSESTSSEDECVQKYSKARTLNLRVRKSINYNENNLLKKLQVSNEARLTRNMKRLNTNDNSNLDVATVKKGSSSEVRKSIIMAPRTRQYSRSLTTKSISNNADTHTPEKNATKKNETSTTKNINRIDEDDSSDSAIFERITRKTFDKAALVKTPSNITETPRRKSRVNYNESINKNKCHTEISVDNTDINLDTKTNDAKYILFKDCTVIINKGDVSTLNRKQIATKDKSQQILTPKRKTVTSKVKTPITPKINSLTPSMQNRNAFITKSSTPLHEARARLHVSAVPKSLPCREEEFNNIYTFLKGKLLDNSGGCMYISGVPGTGKTATVNEVIRCLRRMVTKRDLDNFEFVEINGMKLTEPRQAYVQILKQLTNKTATWEQAHRLLEKRFMEATSKKRMTLLLVDELDLLCNKRQDVVYNILDWPTKLSARLIVITIANTMDLPERVMMGRVTSRLGLTRLTFHPYNHKQLQEIVITRLKDSNAFRSEAVQLVARKIAAVSGDARRALDICRRATEIAESHDEEIVSIKNINQALTEMIASVKVEAIRHCSKMEQIFLQAVCAEVARTGVEETSFKNVYKQLEDLCLFDGLKVPTVTQALAICGRLGANRLLICEHSRIDIYQRILLNVSSDDIHFSTQNIDI